MNESTISHINEHLQMKNINIHLLLRKVQSKKVRTRLFFSLLAKQIVTVFVISLIISTVVKAAPKIASASGNWSNTVTWGGSAIPTLADDVTINSGVTITVDGSYSCNTLTFAPGVGSSTLTISGINSLSITGLVSMPLPSAGNLCIINVNAGSLSCGSLTMLATTIGLNDIINISTGSLTIAGAISTGTTGCQFIFTGSGIFNVGGSFLGTPTITTFAGSTVNYFGAAQTVLGTNYNNLKLSGTGIKTLQAGTTTIGGNLSISGSASATTAANMTIGSNLSIGDGTTFTVAGFALTISGTTTIGGGISGNLIINSAAGVKTFTGLITINTGSIWNNSGNSPVSFQGGITNNGTFTAGTGVQSFITNTQSLIGTFSIPNITVTGAGISLTNNNALTIATALTGTGGLINASTGILNLNFAGPPTISVLNATASGNIVNYNLNGAQTVFNTTYDGLTLSGGNIKTINGTVVTNILNFSGAATLAIGANSLTATTVTRISPIAITLSTGSFTVNGNLVLATTDPITLSGAGTLSVIGNLTCGTLTGNAGIVNIGGSFAPNAFTINTSTVNFNGSLPQSIPVLAGYNNLTISNGQTNPLLGSVTVNNILTLTSGVLKLGNFNLTLNNSIPTSIQPAIFGTSNMIVTDGSGYLMRGVNTISSLVYPIGSINAGTYFYSPVSITPSAATAGNISVRNVYGSLGANFINNYWDLQSSVAKTVSAVFTYDGAEIVGVPTTYTVWNKPNGSTWQTPPPSGVSTTTPASNLFTVTNTTLPAVVSSYWSTGGPSTYYSYQTGDWNNPNTWTSDPGGSTQLGNTVPGLNDYVVILSGRTVSLSNDISTQNLSITINNGGFLNQTTYQYSNGLKSLSGQGTLQLGSTVADYFPNTITNTFVAAGGGTTEYNASVNITQTTHNNLSINTGGTVIYKNNASTLTINGNLLVKQGNFQINDATPQRIKVTISGNVNVNVGASFTVGSGNTVNSGDTPTTVAIGGVAPFTNYYDLETHRIVVNGDFTNKGIVKFTNQTYPQFNAYSSNGAATVYFQGSTNNTLSCNGNTDFYNLVLDKGTNQTFLLTVYSTAFNNFRLFGANNAALESVGANPNIRKALWIRNGTLDLTGLTMIPSLSEGGISAAPSSDYFIPSNGAMILDGPFVSVLSTADDYTEINAAYNLVGGSNALYGINTSGAGSGLSILGDLQINNGYLSTRESPGLLYWSYASGQFIMNGGTVDTKQFHNPEGGNIGLISYSQTGGNMIFRGRFQNTINYPTVNSLSTPAINTARAFNGIDGTAGIGTLSINSNVANGFTMSGGNISIYDVCGTTAPTDAILINCSVSNINVTGGTFLINPTSGTVPALDANYLINSLASFGNVIINRTNGSSTVQLNSNPLTVLQNLSIQSGSLDASNWDVNIGGNFTLENGTIYTPGTNNTVFNGMGTQKLTVNFASALGLNNLKINKSPSDALILNGSQNVVNVAGLIINGGKLDDNGKIINVSGNIYNAGIHMSTPGTGKIVVNSNAAIQTIDGNGSGIFNNLDLNNTSGAVGSAPISLSNNATINGILNLVSNRIFTIGSNNLKIATTGSIISFPGFSNTCFIQTNGQVGDGGITKAYSSTTAFMFPVGSYSTKRPAAYAYTPASIGFSVAPSTYGSITVNPVGTEHPNTTTKNISLTYYWHVKSNNFTLASNSVNHSYVYSQTDVNSTETNYVPARYNYSNFTWTNGTIASINTGSNTIGLGVGDPFMSNTNTIDGDYTTGNNNPTNPFGVPKIYYSRQSGLWSNVNSWSLISHIGAAAGSVPGAADVVLIGGNDSIYLATNTTIINTDIRSCASLQIEGGSALDIGYNPGCSFSVVSSNTTSALGNGNFRLTTSWNSGSTFKFPSGDFSDFNQKLGTTELYSTNPASGTTYWLPQGVLSYGNLILSPLGGSNIIFANNNLTIYGNLITRGQNADSWFCPAWNLPYPTAPTVLIAKTITINGSMLIQSGALIWYGNAAIAQNFVVNGDVVVYPWGAIQNGGGASNQSMAIGGSLINNTNNATQAGVGTVSYVDFSANGVIPVTFFGPNNAFITNTAGTPRTVFSTVTINKGSSQSTSLTCNIGGTLTTPGDNWLTLQNGTFIYNSSTNLNISTVTPFTIPSTAGLTLNTPSTINIAQGNVNTNTLYLNGKLTVTNGNVLVGNAANNQHNDIEYSSGGASAIQVDGGNLIVNGAIRRNPSNAAGILNYTQTGSSAVTINGNSTLNTNAKLEVLNSGSQFNMLGNSTLTIVRGGGGNAFGDLYLWPQTSAVTGTSTIIFSLGALAAQNYQLDANVPLNNLSITGAVGKVAKVTLMVSPVVINGNLTINSNSTLDANVANNINVTLNGNFINSGTYSAQKNLTTFGGNSQNITGTTTPNIFYDLNVSPVTSLTLNPVSGSVTVADNLIISSGTLACGAFKVSVSGNFTNNGNFTDNNALGTGINLIGISSQHIAGTGTFGWMELNNPTGAVLDNSISLNEHLTLTKGVFNIKENLLTLQQNSTIDANGTPFSATKMVTTDGVLGTIGIKKYFTTIPQSFTYPIGTSGKYTPAVLSLTSSDYVGSVRINNVNNTQPTVLDAANALKYYWDVESSGISGFQGNLVFNYLPGDVVGGPESNYKSAWLIIPGTSWSINGGTVTPASKTIQFNHPAGTENLSGEYTAGNGTAFPANVPTYTSITSGNWNDPTIWTQTAGSPHTLTTGPNGFIVIIRSSDVVSAAVNYSSAYQTTINGKLIVNAGTFGHNFGIVTGNGILSLQSGSLPAGVYTTFLDCLSNGTIEYGGNGNYTIIADLYDNIPNMLFSGTGTRTLPDKDLTICHSFKIGTGIDNPVVDNSVYNHKLTILGTIEYYSGIFNSGTGANATVTFASLSSQTIGGTLGNFTGSNAFNNFEINNASGLTINNNGAIEINGNLLLTNGLINTSAINNSKLTLTNTTINCVIPLGGSSFSYVNGPLAKNINQGDNFSFPIGQGTLPGNRISLSSTQTGPLLWTAQYINPNSTFNSYASPLAAVSWNEYWSITPAVPSQAIVKLNYYPNSDITPLTTQNGLPDMRVAVYNTGSSQWNAISSTAAGNNYNGIVSTSGVISLPALTNNYTLAAVTTIIPKAKFSPTGPICGNTGSTGIPVTFSAPTPIILNYTLSYNINGTPQTSVTITPAMLPYSLPTLFAGSSAVYTLTGFTYNNGLGTGVVDNNPVVAYANPTTANAGLPQSVCGITSVTLNGNNPGAYTGIWSIPTGTGGTVLTPNNPASQFNGVLPNSYNLQWTISNGTCKSISTVSIAFTTRPTQPSALTPQSFCNSSTIGSIAVTAPTGFVNWYSDSTYPPSLPALTGSTALISGTTYYADAVSGTCISSSPLTPVTVTINPLPAAITGITSICAGLTTTMSDVTAGGTWSSATPSVGTINAAGLLTAITPGTSVISYTLGTGCAVTATATVNSQPSLIITSPAAICAPLKVDITDGTITTGSSLFGGLLSYWTNAGGTIALTTPTVVSISGTYYIKVTTATGCYDIKPVTVIIDLAPTTGPIYRKPN